MSNMTKEMKAKCLNTKMQAFCALDKDVQDVLASARKAGDAEWLLTINNAPVWGKIWGNAHIDEPSPSGIYRIRPDYREERAFYEEVVQPPAHGSKHYWLNRRYTTSTVLLVHVAGLTDFGGVVYEKDGQETLRPHLSLDFGTPKRVRFYED